ncbi:hypothetical protein [Lentzea flaviverrucosa]|uniref:Uncharacterized protein n=1 Tax=Lentzea flaviverrucosa TaxID=200379 RepID=A0A1H9J5R6_9PSEU|nr:hypothetical protein [Lentzea flaviverrucosa]RDI26396.1 hypothetical protein DFR72_10737 [Lentzea flaviverrucosa]SEQ81965.1 hypothetical protein SAMN05216195_103130 [Lentzea flaviverrucosa]
MRAISALVLTATALLATALPASAAAVEAAVALQSQARLEARGVAVVVPVRVMCQNGATGSLWVQVTQNVRGDLAIGDKYTANVPCTGEHHKVDVTVVARTKAFRPGVAFTSASLNVHLPPDGSGIAESDREMLLVR